MHILFPSIIPAVIQRVIWIPTRLVLEFFGDLEIRGLENIRNTRSNVIIASNHSSDLDTMTITACLPFFSRHLPLIYTSREKNFYKDTRGWKRYVYGGIIFKILGAYKLTVGHRDYKQSLHDHIALLKNGFSVLIFPTGKKNVGGETPQSKGGAAFLARETTVPIIPTLIEGEECISVSDLFMHKRKITVTFGAPIYTQDIFANPEIAIIDANRDDYKIASHALMDRITNLSRTTKTDSKKLH